MCEMVNPVMVGKVCRAEAAKRGHAYLSFLSENGVIIPIVVGGGVVNYVRDVSVSQEFNDVVLLTLTCIVSQPGPGEPDQSQ